MKKISAKSKLGQYFVEAYKRSTWHTLKDAYVKPSEVKQEAFKGCQQICEAENGDCLKVISRNIYGFTVAFEVQNLQGAIELRVITRYRDYLVAFGDKL